ncbi:hypothetical protein MNBD_ALPHA03-1380 [hydrothermal vent metagenome]|uniref:PilZ domain-containing protein n=1 Tax=hydrothermal vent metagenome TaxID=652676 RepID=A0A3B1B6Z0_9ZZZZ
MSNLNKDIESEKDIVRRRFSRQPVLLKAVLDTGHYEFECIAYDLSLKGIKIKLDLPLETKCEVWLLVKDCPKIPAHVVWSKEGYIGLEFSLSSKQVTDILGTIGVRLPKV